MVLLIIAVVAINAITESNIVGYAENAAKGYNQAKADEEVALKGYETFLENTGKESTTTGNIERIYSVVNGKWVDEYVNSEDKIPAGATITAKFYKTSTTIKPDFSEEFGEGAPTFESGYAYKLVIEGEGEMPAILDMDVQGSGGAWGYDIYEFLNELNTDNIMPYITELEVNGVSNIGAGALMYAISLSNINISDSVETLGTGAISYCFSLNSFDFKNIKNIGNHAFSGTRLKNVVIPDGITTVGEYAFSSSKIESIDLNDLKTVSEAMFIGCDYLTNVEIGENTTTLESNAFEECVALESIDLKNVNSIEKYTFYNCINLKTIKIKASSLTHVGDSNVFHNIAPGSKIYVLNQEVKDALEGKYDPSITTVEIKTLAEMDQL